MDQLTHIFTGLVLGELSGDTTFEKGLVVLSSVFPDWDSNIRFFSKNKENNYFLHHRGAGHSILSMIASIFLLSFLSFYFFNTNFSKAIFLSTIGISSHILWDLLTLYKVQLLYPFSTKRFGKGIFFITDPIMLVILIASCALLRFNSPKLYTISIPFYIVFRIFLYLLIKTKAKVKDKNIVDVFSTPFSLFKWGYYGKQNNEAFTGIIEKNRIIERFRGRIGSLKDLSEEIRNNKIVKAFFNFCKSPFLVKDNNTIRLIDRRYSFLNFEGFALEIKNNLNNYDIKFKFRLKKKALKENSK